MLCFGYGVSSTFLSSAWRRGLVGGPEHPSCLALGWGHSRWQSSGCVWGKVCRDEAATSSSREHPVVLVTVGASGSRSSAPPPSTGALQPLLATGRVPPEAEILGDAACSSGEPGAGGGGVMWRLEMTPSLEKQQQARGDANVHDHGPWPGLVAAGSCRTERCKPGCATARTRVGAEPTGTAHPASHPASHPAPHPAPHPASHPTSHHASHPTSHPTPHRASHPHCIAHRIPHRIPHRLRGSGSW